jgi:hypothetical protein
VLALGVLAALATAANAGQTPDASATPPPMRHLVGGGEATVVAGPVDNEAFFNYTDYEHNELRIARVRLLGEWRIVPRFSILAEARTENGDGVQIPALYARWQPWSERDLTVQVGRIPPVIGGFGRRAYGRDNPLVGSPLGYQYLTSLRPDALPTNADDLLKMRGRGWQPSYPLGSQSVAPGLPVISSSRWDTGAEASWTTHKVDVAGAVTLGSPATPVVRDPSDGLMYSGRVAGHLPGAITVGFSAARGAWIDRSVMDLLPERLHDMNSETVVGMDVEGGVGPWLIRGEWLHATFVLPFIGVPDPGSLGTSSAFAEVRYRLLTRWQIAGRVDHLGFSDIVGTVNGGLPTSWDAPVNRVEGVVGYRVLRNLEVRAGYQYNWRDGGRVHQRGYPTVLASIWF